MTRHYHGTTIENAINMVEVGFNEKPPGTWICSDDHYLYMWSSDKVEDEFEPEECKLQLINSAFNSAQITAALNNVLRKELVVLCFEFPDDVKELIEHDYSCENMADVADAISLSRVKASHIVEMYVSKEGYEPMLRAFVLGGLINGHLLNKGILTDTEEKLIKAVSKSDIMVDEMYDFDYESYRVKTEDISKVLTSF